MSARRPALASAIPFLAIVVLGTVAVGAPGDSLSGADMLDLHRVRRTALGELIGEGVAVLFAAPSTSHHDYRPAPDLLYLTGIDEPGAALVIRVERPAATARSRAARRLERRLLSLAEEIVSLGRRAGRSREARAFGREVRAAAASARASAREAAEVAAKEQGEARVVTRLYLPTGGGGRWAGPRLSPGPAAVSATGVAEVRPITALYDDLENDLAAAPDLHLLTRTTPPRSHADRLDALTRAKPRSLEPLLSRLRVVKDAEEVARIRRSCELTARGLVATMRGARPGMAEYELQAMREFACRRGGAPRQAFRSIVGSGPNSVILHYFANRRVIGAGDLVLMDVGAEYMGYAADVTRTFPVGPRFTEEQARVYDVVLEAQEAAIAAVRPGATLRLLNQVAARVVAKGGYGKSLAHGVSHYVGLDVHDPAPRGPLAAGMVITVEPGVYLQDSGFGIRIEDTVLVTEEGSEVLSSGVPKARVQIEALRAGAPK